VSEPIEPTTHQIPGWDRPAWAVRGVKAGRELVWQQEASVDVTYDDHGVEAVFAAELVRVDQVVIDESSARVVLGQVVIRHCDGCSITPSEARKLADALIELADFADEIDNTFANEIDNTA
jgi:hypothetical protein